jgi:uncharacterized repeat protein (TIGR01451 family)
MNRDQLKSWLRLLRDNPDRNAYSDSTRIDTYLYIINQFANDQARYQQLNQIYEDYISADDAHLTEAENRLNEALEGSIDEPNFNANSAVPTDLIKEFEEMQQAERSQDADITSDAPDRTAQIRDLQQRTLGKKPGTQEPATTPSSPDADIDPNIQPFSLDDLDGDIGADSSQNVPAQTVEAVINALEAQGVPRQELDARRTQMETDFRDALGGDTSAQAIETASGVLMEHVDDLTAGANQNQFINSAINAIAESNAGTFAAQAPTPTPAPDDQAAAITPDDDTITAATPTADEEEPASSSRTNYLKLATDRMKERFGLTRAAAEPEPEPDAPTPAPITATPADDTEPTGQTPEQFRNERLAELARTTVNRVLGRNIEPDEPVQLTPQEAQQVAQAVENAPDDFGAAKYAVHSIIQAAAGQPRQQPPSLEEIFRNDVAATVGEATQNEIEQAINSRLNLEQKEQAYREYKKLPQQTGPLPADQREPVAPGAPPLPAQPSEPPSFFADAQSRQVIYTTMAEAAADIARTMPVVASPLDVANSVKAEVTKKLAALPDDVKAKLGIDQNQIANASLQEILDLGAEAAASHVANKQVRYKYKTSEDLFKEAGFSPQNVQRVEDITVVPATFGKDRLNEQLAPATNQAQFLYDDSETMATARDAVFRNVREKFDEGKYRGEVKDAVEAHIETRGTLEDQLVQLRTLQNTATAPADIVHQIATVRQQIDEADRQFFAQNQAVVDTHTTDTVRSLLNSMDQQARGVGKKHFWTDKAGEETVKEYREVRKGLEEQVASARKNRSATLGELEQQLVDSDKAFISNNQRVIDSYLKSSGARVLADQPYNAKYGPDPEQVRTVVERITTAKGMTKADRDKLIASIEPSEVGQSSLRGMVVDVLKGNKTLDDVQTAYQSYYDQNVKMYAGMLSGTQAPKGNRIVQDQETNLQRSIERGSDKLVNELTEPVITQVGRTIMQSRQLMKEIGFDPLNSEMDKHQLFAGLVGNIDEYDRLRKQKGFDIDKEVSKALGTYALKELGYQNYMRDVSTEIMQRLSTAPSGTTTNDQLAIINGIISDKFGEHFPADQQKQIRNLVLTTIKGLPATYIERNVLNSIDFQAGLTAASAAPLVLPQLKSATSGSIGDRRIEKLLMGYDPKKDIEDGRPPMNESQITRELVRRDYNDSVTQILKAFKIENAQDHAERGVQAALGGFISLPGKEGEAVWEEQNAFVVKLKQLSPGQKFVYNRLNDEQKKDYLKKVHGGTYEEQRINGLVNEFLSKLPKGTDPDKKISSKELVSLFGQLGIPVDEKMKDITLRDAMKDLFGKLHSKQVQQMLRTAQDEEEKNTAKGDLAKTQTFKLAKSGVASQLMGMTDNRWAENKARKILLTPLSWYTRVIPLDFESRIGYKWETVVNFDKAAKLYGQSMNSFMADLHINRNNRDRQQAIMDAIQAGKMPDGLSLYQRKRARQLMAQYQLLDKQAKWREKNPGLAKLLDKRAAFYSRDDVSIIQAVLRGRSPIEMSVNLAFNHLALKIAPKHFEISNKGVLVFSPWYSWKMQTQQKIDFFIETRIKRPLINAGKKVTYFLADRLIYAPARRMGRAIYAPIRSFAMRRLGSIIVQRFEAGFAKLMGKLTVGLLTTIGMALTGVGLIGRALSFLFNLPGLRQIKQIIQIALLSVTLNIALFIWGIISGIWGFVVGAGTAIGGFGAWASGLFGKIGGISFAGAPGVPIMMINTVGITSGWVGGIANAISGAVNAIANASLTQTLSQIFSRWSLLNPGFFAAVAGIGAVTTSVLFNSGLNLPAVLQQGPDMLSGIESSAFIPLSPLKVLKTASRSNATNGDPIIYNIQVTSPACAGELKVTDTVPTNSIFDNNFSFTPNPIPADSPIQSVTPSGPDASGLITWTITLKPDRVRGPCNGSAGGGILRNPSYLTRDEIIGLISGTILGQQPGEVRAGFTEVGQVADLIIEQARIRNVNPMLVIGIFNRETQTGATGPGKLPRPGAVRRPQGQVGFGCRNLGNARPGGPNSIPKQNGASPNNDDCVFGADPNKPDRFAFFYTYEGSIKTTYQIMDTYMAGGANTIEALANIYSPASDCTPDCATGADANRIWKQLVGCAIRYKNFSNGSCTDWEVGGEAGGGGGPGVSPGDMFSVTLSFQVKANKTETKGCITNKATATIGDSPNLLTGSSQVTTSIDDDECELGGTIAEAASNLIGPDGAGPLIRAKDTYNGQLNAGKPQIFECRSSTNAGDWYYNHHVDFDGDSGEENIYQGPSGCGGISGFQWFWCTWTPIKAYQAVGKRGLDGQYAAEGQRGVFIRNNGYTAIRVNPSDTANRLPDNLKSGDVIFFYTDADRDTDHVGVIYSVTLDASGNGNIETRESNAEKKVRIINVVNGVPQGPSRTFVVAGIGSQDVIN